MVVAILMLIAGANGVNVPWPCWLVWALAGMINAISEIIKDKE